ncbi:MAG: hypothetical protein ABFD92_03935 [Planctomycetaceae bacterium]|nr:hypothetical protein [Planctomycetaceae bacterium]
MNRVLPWMVTMALLGGCTNTPQFSRQRYDTLYTGMPAYEVRGILGKPKIEGPDAWEYEHFKPYYKAIIHFHNGAVARREWMNDPPQAKLPPSAPQPAADPAPDPAPEPAPEPAPQDPVIAPGDP